MHTNIFNEPKMKHGEGKARLFALKIGDVLKCDDYDRNKWVNLARHYGLRMSRCLGGVKRVG